MEDFDVRVSESGRTMVLENHDEGDEEGEHGMLGDINDAFNTASAAGSKQAATATDSDDDEGAKITAPESDFKFQPLQPLAGKSYNKGRRSSPRKIPNASSSSTAASSSATQQYTTDSRTSSAAGSPENGFMNNMVDPVASATSARLPNNEIGSNQQQQQLSHTPPADVATSYESSHFGKRARAGVSASVVCVF
jgi:hypothetical protein